MRQIQVKEHLVHVYDSTQLYATDHFLKAKFADLLQRLNEIYGSNITEQKSLQMLIDALFLDTKFVVKIEIALLFLGYIFPFIY